MNLPFTRNPIPYIHGGTLLPKGPTALSQYYNQPIPVYVFKMNGAHRGPLFSQSLMIGGLFIAVRRGPAVLGILVLCVDEHKVWLR